MHPVLLELGPLRIHSYGLLIALGGALSVRFWRARRASLGLPKEEDFWLFVNALLVGGFAGGRLLYVLEYTRPFSADFWSALVSLTSGFSVLGAFLGVTAALWRVARRTGAPLLPMLDGVCLMAPVWHAFGRVGCFLAGCCFGRPTDEPWGVVFTDPRSQVEPAFLGRSIHPAQLYEAAGDAALAALLFLVVRPAVTSGRQPAGSIALSYFMGYAALRFATEYWRGDTVTGFAGLTAAQGISVLLGSTALMAYLYTRQRFRQERLCIRS